MEILILSLLLIAPILAVDIGTCYTPGPAFPPADIHLSETHFTELRGKLDDLVNEILNEPDGWRNNITSFAIEVTTRKETIWDHFYTAPILGDYNGSEPTPVTGDTAFRIASISKTFTVYAVLLENKIALDDPISKYLPDLLDEGDLPRGDRWWFPDWEHITIRSLASQLSGISRETGLQDIAEEEDMVADPVAHGFPPLESDYVFPCTRNDEYHYRSCNASEIIRVARKRAKVFEANDRSTYSNVAYSLLGLALEKVTGKPFSEIISSSLLEPLGMDHTRTTQPDTSAGIIPWGPNDWHQDLDSDTPSGGIFSTAHDLSRYLRSILSSELLPVATTNAWMKPHSWTISGANSAYGMPWEIYRTPKLTPDGRAIDLITKGGSLGGYFSNIIMLPEFGIGVTILIAGDYPALGDIREKIISTLIPAVEKLTRDVVRKQYTGSWAHWHSLWDGVPDMNFSMKLEVDDFGPGIRVVDWVSNGTDFLSVYGKLKGMPQDKRKWQARLVPTAGNHKSVEGWMAGSWRLTVVPSKVPENESKVFNEFCVTDVDSLMYGGVAVEQFIFLTDHGEATWMFIPGLNIDMSKCDNYDKCEGTTSRRHGGSADKFEGWNGKQMPLNFV